MLFLLGCAGPSAGPAPAPAPTTVFLAREAPASLELPASNLPDGAPASPDLAVPASWKLQRTEGGVAEYKAALPVVGEPCGDDGVSLTDGTHHPTRDEFAAPLQAERFVLRGPAVFVRLAASAPAPAEGWTLHCPAAATTEDTLNLGTSHLPAADFSAAERRVAGATHRGVYLPAPARAAWSVHVPEHAVFATTVYRLGGALKLAGADGAVLRVEADVDGKTQALGDFKADPTGTAVRVDLATLAGKDVTLRLTSDPRQNPLQDYVFAAEPTVFVPSTHPRRVVLVFIDTLRPDHLGYGGYARPTSPTIDGLAAQGVVFTHARSVAGWTLPGSLAALSGWLPHQWSAHATLADGLAAAGFTTAATVANEFISPSFGVERGWGHYISVPGRGAQQQTDDALALLDANADRDLALLVHYIDPHVPYEEPEPYRSMWAAADPVGFPPKLDREKLANYVHKDVPHAPDDVRAYVTARYDQEIRYVDTELARLLAKVGDDATVVLFADHGEELWDHGGFEHGHTDFDELLRVPLVVRAPGLAPGKVDAPVSLTDLAPTVLDLVGASGSTFWGTSLLPAARGDAAALATLDDRALVFGWRLYDADRWGILHHGKKWEARQGWQHVYDVVADPGETTDIAKKVDLGAFATEFTHASGLPLTRAWRVQVLRLAPKLDVPVTVTLRSPGGFSKVWTGYDHLGTASRHVLRSRLEGDVAILEQAPGAMLPGELFAAPKDPTAGLRVTLTVGAESTDGTVAPTTDVVSGKNQLDLTFGQERIVIRAASAAELPEAEALALGDDTLRQLRALGYAE